MLLKQKTPCATLDPSKWSRGLWMVDADLKIFTVHLMVFGAKQSYICNHNKITFTVYFKNRLTLESSAPDVGILVLKLILCASSKSSQQV